ncbi:MAG: Gfo/Idh/MocA family protein [Hyphomicrobiaceae bacterium]
MKIAVVGAGQIADAHIVEISRIESAEVVSLCDLYESPLRALQDKYAIPHVSTDLGEVLTQSAPDVVHITTPPSSHLAIARQCLEAGAHVYVEKPLAVTFAETKELLELAERCGRLVCLGSNRIFASAQRTALDKIHAGEIGPITHMDGLFSYDLKGIFGRQVLSNPEHWIANLPGQLFKNNLNHPLAAIVPFLSDDLEIRAWADDWGGSGIVFDELRLEIIDRVNRRSAYIVFTSNVKPGAFRVSYFGRDKAIFLNNNANTLIIDSPQRVPGMLGNILGIRHASKQLGRQFRRRLRRFVFGGETFFTDLQEMFRAFYASIENNGSPPVPYSQILRAARIMDEMVNQIGRPVGKARNLGDAG